MVGERWLMGVGFWWGQMVGGLRCEVGADVLVGAIFFGDSRC